MNRVILLGKIPIFQSIPAEQLLTVAEIMAEEHALAGHTVFNQADAAHHLYVIVTGEVEVWTEQVHVATLGSGECFGELAILADATRSATVRAKTDLYCLKLARDDFEDLLDVSPGLSMAIMRVLTARLRESVTHDTSLLAEQGA